MKLSCFLLPVLFFLSGPAYSQTPVYLNDQNIEVSLGASMAADPFQNVSTEQSLKNIIDAPTAGSGEDHNQQTHVWVSGGPLELDFDLGQEYDLRLVHFWNYLNESHDVDDLDLTFFDANRNLVGRILDVKPAIGGGGQNPIFAESITLSFPSEIRYINAVLTGSNGQVDFNNMGFTGIPTEDSDIPRVVESYINNGDAQRSMIQSIGVRFDRNAFERLTTDALRVQNIATGEMIDISGTEVAYDPRNNSASWYFDRDVNVLLADGNYIAWLARDNFIGQTERASCGLNPPPLDDFVFGFHQYAGDSDGDRDVDFKDSCVFRETWQQGLNDDRYRSFFDFDLSNQVVESDRAIVQATYFNILPAAPALHLFLRNDTGVDLADFKSSRYNIGASAIDLPEGSSWSFSIDSGAAQSIDDFVVGDRVILGESTIDQLNRTALTVGEHTLRIEIRNSEDTILTSDEMTFEYLGDVPCGPFFISTPPGGVSLGQVQGAQPLSLAPWTVEGWPGSQGAASWEIAPDGLSVTQTRNSAPSALISDQSILNLRITGTFRVNTGGDDDLMGFIFGYQNSKQFYVFDWKQRTQNFVGGTALRGMSIKRLNAEDREFTEPDFWWSDQDRENTTILSAPNDIPWKDFQDYQITLDFTPGRIVVEVREEGVLLDRLEVEDDTFSGGRFGFYNYSQDNVIYQGFTQEALNNLYFYDAEAEDPDGGTVTYSLANNADGSAPPAGATVNASTGALIWEPDTAGTFPFTLIATDNDGLTDTQTFNVTVTPVDLPPTVDLVKTAPSILPGEPISFQVRAQDDQQLFRVRLFVDDLEVPLDGQFNYTTTFDRIGTVELRAVAIDSAEQVTSVTSFVRVLNPDNPRADGQNSTPISPPGQTSGSPTDLRPLVSFQAPTSANDDPTLFVGTADPNGGTFRQWFFEWAPAGKVDPANLASPAVLWQELGRGTDPLAAEQFATITPGDFPNELIAFRLRAENTNGLGAIASIVFNPQSNSNSGPTTTTGPGSGTPALAAFTAPLTVSDDRSLVRGTIDANGGTLQSWVLDFAPRNQVDPTNLTDPAVAWSILAQGTAPGTNLLLAALDPATFDNQAYVFRLTARNTGGAGTIASLIYNPVASGFTGPGGTTGINPGSAQRPVCRITSPQMPNDDRSMLLGSILANGGTLQNWIIDYAPRTQVNPNDLTDPAVAWTLLAEGGDEKTQELLTPLTAADFNAGTWIVRLRAFNTNGLGCLASIQLDTGDTSVPSVAILTPAAEEDITFISDATGTVSAGGGVLDSWKLELAPTSEVSLANLNASANWVELGSGSTEISEDVLGMIDPTGLQNGSYVLRLSARNTNGRGIADGIIIYVCGEAKLGNFRLEFEDLNIPLAGIPIRINRIYDTLNTNRSGDFGFGWTLGIGDPDLRETVPDNGDSFFFPNPFEIGTRVFLTTPDGRRVGFTFNIRNPRNRFLYVDYEPYFEPDPGVYETLTIAPSDFQRVEVDAAGAAYTPLIPFGFNPENYRLTTREGLIYHINQRTGLQRISDRNGQQVNFSRNAITHSSGRELTLERDSRGRITSVVIGEENALQYIYDANGDLVEFIDQVGASTKYSYLARPAHFLSTIATPQDANLGRPSFRVLYEDGRLARVVDAEGNTVSQQSFDPTTFSGSQTDALGNVTSLEYNARGNVVSVESPLGFTKTLEYDDPANPDLVTTSVDANGNRTEVEYNSDGLPTLEVRPDGSETAIDYRNDQLPTKIAVSGSSGNILIDVDLIYDNQGNATEVVNQDGSTRTFQYDDQGRITRMVDYDGVVQTLTYLPGNTSSSPNVIETPEERMSLVYNSLGSPTSVTDTDGNEVTYEYDPQGKLKATSLNGEVISALQYDSNGRLVREETGGGVRTMSYDNRGNLLMENTVSDSETRSIQYQYDAANQLTSVTTPLGLTTEFVYDADGRMIREKFPDGQERVTLYDGNENPITLVDRRGYRTVFTYNEINQIVKEEWFLTDSEVAVKTLETSYNELGQPQRQSDGATTYTTTYGASGQPVTISNAGSLELPLHELGFTYDAQGRLTSIADQDGVKIEQQFDETGGVSALSWSGLDSLASRVSFSKTSEGLLTGIERFASLAAENPFAVTRFQRDATDLNVVGIQHTNAASEVLAPQLSYTFVRDAVGRITSQTRAGETISYGYDEAGQLTSATSTTGDFEDESYQYDAIGNRLSSHLAGTSLLDEFGQLVSDGQFSYGYDAEKNLVKMSSADGQVVYDLAYDHRNRLTSLDKSVGGSLVTDYDLQYDVRDQLVTRTLNGEVMHSSYFGKNIWADYDESGAIKYRYFFSDQNDAVLARWDPTTGTTWALTDQVGSTRALIDSSGTILSELSYDSFGNLTSEISSLERFRFGFTGREHLFDEFYYFRSRIYSTRQGRFLSEDPIGYLGGDINLTRYANNDPLRFIDPLGTETIPSLSIGGVITSGLQAAASRLSAALFKKVAIGALSGAVIAPVLDALCLLISGESERISLSRAGGKAGKGALIGAAFAFLGGLGGSGAAAGGTASAELTLANATFASSAGALLKGAFTPVFSFFALLGKPLLEIPLKGGPGIKLSRFAAGLFASRTTRATLSNRFGVGEGSCDLFF